MTKLLTGNCFVKIYAYRQRGHRYLYGRKPFLSPGPFCGKTNIICMALAPPSSGHLAHTPI